MNTQSENNNKFFSRFLINYGQELVLLISIIILFVVVYGLYEVSIFLVARTEKQINEQFADDDYSQDTDNDFDDPLIKDFDEKK